MRTRLGVLGGSLLAIATLVVAQGTATAQNEPPFDPAIDLQLFDYAAGPKTFMSVHDASVVSPNNFVADFFLTFLTDPFTVYNVDEMNDDELTGTRSEVVGSLLSGQLSGAYGLTDKLHLAASLPLILSMSGDGLDPTTGMAAPDGLQATGLGDLLVEAKSKLWQNDALRLAGLAGLTLPTSFGTENDFLGDDLPSVRARAALSWQNPTGKIHAGANLGIILRKPRTIYSSEVGQQLTYGFGGAFEATKRVDVVAEMFGRTGLTTFDLDASPLEFAGGVRVLATPKISVLAGGGAGLVKGIGSPGLRVFLSVGYAPSFEDDDGDGIPNLDDRCPLLAEDSDGFEDLDGCPDNDNDGDLREDSVDQCPNEKEDLDGFQDDDGCPDPDNDGDGILDVDDRCPLDAEDKAQPWPEDGCPASMRDTDADGIMDDVDQCIEEFEDEDGFEDWDGCPDPDNDGDGIADDSDQCPLCKGEGSEDGCPVIEYSNDVAHMEGDRMIVDVDLPFAGTRLRTAGKDQVSKIAALMFAQPDVIQWMLVVADRRSKANAEKKAEEIKAQLVASGIAAESVTILGAQSGNETVGLIARERQEVEGGGMVCPAQYQVEPRPAPAGGAAAPAMQPDPAEPEASEEPSLDASEPDAE